MFSSPFHATGGSLPPQDPTYVPRQADQEFYQALLAGEYCYVLNSRQMGKSSLRSRTQQRLAAAGVRCATLDLSGGIDSDITSEGWCYTLIDLISRELGLQPQPSLGGWWAAQAPLSAHGRLERFLETVVLAQTQEPVVIFIDEVDTVLSLEQVNRDDFFALVRACYNRRASHPTFNRLTIALLGVATPASLIQNPDRTPFNLGRSIVLRGFSLAEAAPLVSALSSYVANPEALLAAILAWTGGQPFLTQKLCDLVVRRAIAHPDPPPTLGQDWIDDLVQTQVIDRWQAQDEPAHLRTLQDRLLDPKKSTTALISLYDQVRRGEGVPVSGDPLQVDLRLTGLVVEQGGQLQVYNLIYGQVFNDDWVTWALAQVRPYSQAITAWQASDQQDHQALLQGAELEAALTWAEDRILSPSDRRFLVESQKQDLQQQLAHSQAQLAARNAELETTGQALAQAEAELQQRSQALEATRGQLHQAQQGLQRARRQTRRWSLAGAAILTLALTGLGVSLGEARHQRRQALTARQEQQITQVEGRIARLQTSRANLELVGLRRESTTLQQQRRQLSQEKTTLQQQRDRLSQERTTLSQQNRQLQVSNRQIGEQVRQVQGQLDSKTQQVQTLSGRVSQVQRDLTAKDQQLTAKTQELDTLEQQEQRVTDALRQTIGTLGIQRLRNTYYVLGGFDSAIGYLDASLKRAQELQDRRGQGYAHGNLGKMYATLGRYPDAQQHHQRHLDIAQEVQDRQGQVQATGNLAEVLYKQGAYSQALPQIQAHLQLAQASQDPLETSQALDELNKGLDLAKTIKDKLGEGQILSYIGDVYLFRGDSATARTYYQQHLEIATQIEDRLGEEEAHRNLARVYQRQGDTNQAIQAYETSQAIAVKIQDRQGQATTLSDLGELYRSIYGHEQALNTYNQALTLARQSDDRTTQAATLNRIGQIYDAQSQYPQARDYYQQSLDIYRQVGARAGEGTTLNNIGLVYDNQGDYAQALDYYQQSLDIYRKVGDRAGEGTTLWNIGATYTKQELYDQALPNLQQAFVIFRSIGNPPNQQGAANWIRDVLNAINQQGNPAEYRRQCQATAGATGVAITEWCEGL